LWLELKSVARPAGACSWANCTDTSVGATVSSESAAGTVTGSTESARAGLVVTKNAAMMVRKTTATERESAARCGSMEAA
jgi:hypothetical protein